MPDPLVPVEVGACRCPGAPHPDGDIVFLHPRIGLHGGAVAQRKIISAIEDKADRDEIMATLTEIYVRYGVAAWNFTNGEETPLPVTPENLEARLLSDFEVGYLVADKADDLYSEGLMSPLQIKASKSSPPTSIAASTSAPTRSSRKPRKR